MTVTTISRTLRYQPLVIIFSFWLFLSAHRVEAQISGSYGYGEEFHPILYLAADHRGGVLIGLAYDGGGQFANSSNRHFYFANREKKFKKLEGLIAAQFHYSRNGYFYVRQGKEIRVIDPRNMKTLHTFNFSEFSKVGVKSFYGVLSSTKHLYFFSNKAVVKIPLEKSFMPRLDGAITIVYKDKLKYYDYGVDDKDRMYGLASYKPERTLGMLEYAAAIYRIDEDGSPHKINSFIGTQYGYNKKRHVAFLPDGRIIVKQGPTATAIIPSNHEGFTRLDDCEGCRYLDRGTTLDQKGNLLSRSIWDRYGRNKVHTLFLPESKSAIDLLAAAEQDMKDEKYDAAYQFADEALKKDDQLANAYFIRGMTRPGFRFFKDSSVPLSDHNDRSMGRMIFGLIYNREIANQENERAKIEQAAIADLTQAIDKNSEYKGWAQYRLGEIYFAKGNFSRAYKYFHNAYTSKFTTPDGLELANLIESGIKSGQSNDLMPFAEALVKKMPNDADSYFLRGAVYYTMERHEAALKDWEQAFERRKNAIYLYNLGVAYSILGNEEKACAALRLATDNGINEAHYYAYKNCGYPQGSVTCHLCNGSGEVDCPTCDPRLGRKVQSCANCGGTGTVNAPPAPRKLGLLLR